MPEALYGRPLVAGESISVMSSGRSAVRILSACDATTCLASMADNGVGNGATASYTNSGTTAMPIIIAVGSNDASTSQSYNLTTTTTP